MSNIARKVTWLSSLGAGLEYYDFIIYGMMVSYLDSLFLTSSHSWTTLMKGFSIFAIGYLIRPFGGVLFGLVSDTYGRKKAFVRIMLLMAFATFAIGLLPTYNQIGIMAGLLLIILRIVQGISFGAELPGALTIVHEYSEPQKACFHSSFVISSVSIGSTMASFILFLLAKNLSREEILTWGWRIPFLIGGSLAFANYWIRKHLHETPEFAQFQSIRSATLFKTPLLNLWKNHRHQTLLGIGMTILIASLVIFNLFLPAYLNTYFGFSLSDVYLSMTYSMVWSVFSLPISGYITDRIGPQKVFQWTCVGLILSIFFLFHLFSWKSIYAVICFMMFYQKMISLLMVSTFPLLAKTFPVEVRNTGIAICYNIAYAITAFIPTLVPLVIRWTNAPRMASWVLMACALMSLACANRLFKGQGKTLNVLSRIIKG